MYSVSQAVVTIPGSVQRLKKQGYSQVILMQDVWVLTQTENADNINNQDIGNNDTIPFIFLTRIVDDIGTGP